MRRFFAGAVTMLLLMVIGLAVGFWALSEPGTTTSAGPGTPGSPAVEPPNDLQPGETWLGDVDLSTSALVTPDGPLRDVHAVGTDVRVTSAGLRVGSVALDAVLPFEVAAEQVGNGIRLYAARDGLAGVSRTATLLGRTFTIQATGTVRAEGGNLVIEPETIDIGAPGPVNDALGAAARELVTIRQAVEGLPPGLVLTRVSVTPDGFAAHLDGNDVSIAGR